MPKKRLESVLLFKCAACKRLFPQRCAQHKPRRHRTPAPEKTFLTPIPGCSAPYEHLEVEIRDTLRAHRDKPGPHH
jgi:hypothetical protein